jgi:hypothetical protein
MNLMELFIIIVFGNVEDEKNIFGTFNFAKSIR